MGLKTVTRKFSTLGGGTGFPPHPDVRLHPSSSFFWDECLIYAAVRLDQESRGGSLHCPTINRAVYVTAMPGDESVRHTAATYIRDSGFEPLILQEDKDHAKAREQRLKDDKILIKPKGVDIALSVRAMEDAQQGLFKHCYLATSDADYLPLIEALRRMGKGVFVLGFQKDFTKRNPKFDYLPDGCYDLEKALASQYYELRGP
jgi:uncharacterized LabA/DUF88 family protein